MEAKQQNRTNGRNVVNGALITLFRAGVITSMVMLVLGATWVVDDGGAGVDYTTIPAAVV